MTYGTTHPRRTAPTTEPPPPSVPLRRVVALFRPHAGRLTLLALIVTFEALFSVTSPFLIRALLDDAIPGRNTAAITALALGMVVASVGSGVLDVFAASLAARIGQDVMHQLRTAVFAHLQSMSLAFFAGTKSGDLLSRIFNDVGGVDQVVTTTMAGIAGNVATLAAIVTGVRTALTVIPAITYWIAGTAIAHGAATASLGTVVAFASMLNRLVRPAAGLSGVGQSINAARSLFDRIFGILDLPIDLTPGTELLPDGRGVARLDHVTFRHAGAAGPALSDIDLTLEPGTVTAIVGATGSGKTTLSQLVPRLIDPTAGVVTIDGLDLRRATAASISQRLGVVAQDTFLLHASIAENLRLVRPDASDDDLVAATSAARIHELIAELPDGYHTVVGDQGHRFSGGERQRPAIARALLRDPDILILDEATSALDSSTEATVMAGIISASRGRTVLVIAHRLSTIRDADLIVVLHEGRIVERGRHPELLAARGRYADLLTAQLRSKDEQ